MGIGQGTNSVDVVRMREAADQMDQSARRVRDRKGDVEEAVGQQLSSFTGTAADSYRGAMTEWYQNADTVITELEHMANKMRDSADDYERGLRDATATADDAATFMRNHSSSTGLTGL
ncbi:WXG100 family type VII secretion target [Saccharopolyspora shandongensis]|uniref:WXG100 family type VII secretion target n=1 Tax=Saccharopolyspora shandongensis TaxID=418495 RepID=UPI00342AAFE1